MLNKSQLAWKNVKTTIEREPVYFFTMVFIAGLMFAFDSMLFSKDVQTICEQGFIMDVLIGMMTVFIVLVTSWFVSYMMQQSFKMRSKEFGLYMLFGIKRKEITRNFQKETLLLAGIAYGIGIVVGVLLKQFLMVIFYDMFRLEYIIEMEFHFGAVVLTALIYFSCYIVAFIKVKKQISNMTILEFSKLKQKNEETKIEKKQLKLRKTSNWLLKGNRLFVWRTA